MVPARVTLMKLLLQTFVENFASVESLCTSSALTFCWGGFEDMQCPVTVTFVEPKV